MGAEQRRLRSVTGDLNPISPEQKISDPKAVRRCLRDLIALSALPARWSGAEPLRIAESLAASLFTTLKPNFVYICLSGGGGAPLTVFKTGRHQTDPSLAQEIGPAILDWARMHDPEELLILPNPLGSGHLRVTVRPVGARAELGVIASAFADQSSPAPAHHIILNVAATQAAIALSNAHLLRSLRESENRVREANAELSLHVNELQKLNVELQNARRAALNMMEDALEARQMVESLNQELRAEIAERQKAAEAERAAREAADAASRAKDEFLATVSHELRTPLNAMLGWARLLSGGSLNEETSARALKSIEQNAKAQAQLIEELLDMSRIISGKFRLNVEPIHLIGVIEAAIESIRPAAEARGVKLQATLDPNAGPVSGDAGRLQQVVWNLLSNAVKFTPRDGRVQTRLARVNSHIEIVVSDTGQGIDPEFLPFVFDRFRQADGSSTRMHGGLGLGLAIVRHIVELHGGSVTADSPGAGQGATFTVRLPLRLIHTKDDGRDRVHPRVESGMALGFQPSSSLEGVKVLIIDDEPETLILLGTVLTHCGASVKTASSAKEGFAQTRAWIPDVIVSDIGMPEEDGYAFMKRVKAWAREAGLWIPAVALTAFARVEDRMKALSSGYQIHVPKPVEPAELVAVIASLIERNSAR